jgi:hypothetical protein
MPLADLASNDLAALFREPEMFESRRAWGSAGFRVLGTSGKIMVAAHPAARGLLFKKYSSDVDERDQLHNFERRVEGADKLRAFVAEKRLGHIVVPRKHIVELRRPFKRSHVLVVEHLDLVADDQTKAAYRRIAPEVLRDLCVVLFRFRGMDSIAKNLPFTTDGRIGLVDTEHWDRSTSKPYLHRVGEYLPRDRRSLAKKILAQLEDDGDADVGSVAAGDFDAEEDTSESTSSDDDFTREEDTSASSSS